MRQIVEGVRVIITINASISAIQAPLDKHISALATKALGSWMIESPVTTLMSARITNYTDAINCV